MVSRKTTGSGKVAGAYKTRLTRTRRTNADINVIKDAILAALKVDAPMTVRQVFYRLVSNGVIGKSENEYKNTVCRILADMRRAREIPFGHITDITRMMRKPRSFGSLLDALDNSHDCYRRDAWLKQPVYVEIWLEKDALAGVLYEVTSRWDVPLMVCRGYPSLSFLNGAAETIAHVGKPAKLYYFGDHDPSGCDITRAVEAGIREFAPNADIEFERVAVNPDQIESMGLPTRPTKKTDSRSKNFEGESVEVDAIPPAMLRQLTNTAITSNIDVDLWNKILEEEAMERECIGDIADIYRDTRR